MSSESLGLLIGGLLPAILFGVSNLFVKASNQAGIGLGPYMIMTGIAVVIVGIAFLFVMPDRTLSFRSGAYAFGMGAIWGIGAALTGLAIARYNVPIGKISPLVNTCSLFTVLLALWIFAEWKQVHVPRLLFGTLFMVIGATLVTKS